MKFRNTCLINVIFLLLVLPAEILLAQQKQLGIADSCNKLPVTSAPFNDDSDKLQFAIISDLWGGYRYGVFEEAVAELEQLQPQFVLSVGDLIDGATYDSELLDKEWTEFDNLVSTLSMPFFYVPGNHDIANAWMETKWKTRLGRPYYYFIHKNALFLCLDTQDGGSSSISEGQIEYFIKVIKDNPDVSWTFIFMHRPVWLGDIGEEEGFRKIEEALSGKNYTVFSGHLHTLSNRIKNGNKYIILGSTGGGSDLRGEEFGELDHISWVTLNSSGTPLILNLKLNCIVKEEWSGDTASNAKKLKIITSTPR